MLLLNRSIVWKKSFHHGGTIFLPWWNDIFSTVEQYFLHGGTVKGMQGK